MRPRRAGSPGGHPGAGNDHHDESRLTRRRTGFNRGLTYGGWNVPVEASSDVEDQRLWHEDLADLDEVQLHAEFLAASYALGSRRADRRVVDRGWLLKRRARLQAALCERDRPRRRRARA